MKLWETITSWLSPMWVLVLTVSFPFITGLNEEEESRNEDVEFKEKIKVYKESDCASPCNEALRELQVIDIQLPAGIDGITYPFTLININFACCHMQKFIKVLVSWAKNESWREKSLQERREFETLVTRLFCVLTVVIVKPRKKKCISQFHLHQAPPPPTPPGYYGAFFSLVSPGSGAFANFALPGDRTFANPEAIPELLTRTRFPIRI